MTLWFSENLFGTTLIVQSFQNEIWKHMAKTTQTAVFYTYNLPGQFCEDNLFEL